MLESVFDVGRASYVNTGVMQLVILCPPVQLLFQGESTHDVQTSLKMKKEDQDSTPTEQTKTQVPGRSLMSS